jgi:uncharacterized membrane protein YgcG
MMGTKELDYAARMPWISSEDHGAMFAELTRRKANPLDSDAAYKKHRAELERINNSISPKPWEHGVMHPQHAVDLLARSVPFKDIHREILQSMATPSWRDTSILSMMSFPALKYRNVGMAYTLALEALRHYPDIRDEKLLMGPLTHLLQPNFPGLNGTPLGLEALTITPSWSSNYDDQMVHAAPLWAELFGMLQAAIPYKGSITEQEAAGLWDAFVAKHPKMAKPANVDNYTPPAYNLAAFAKFYSISAEYAVDPQSNQATSSGATDGNGGGGGGGSGTGGDSTSSDNNSSNTTSSGNNSADKKTEGDKKAEEKNGTGRTHLLIPVAIAVLGSIALWA